MDIEIDETLSALDAVKAHVTAKEVLRRAMRDEHSVTVGDIEKEPGAYVDAKEATRDAERAVKVARVQAQYAVKRETGYFPFELALMGL